MPDLQSSLYVGHMGVENEGERIPFRGLKAPAVEARYARYCRLRGPGRSCLSATTALIIASLDLWTVVIERYLVGNLDFMLLFNHEVRADQKNVTFGRNA